MDPNRCHADLVRFTLRRQGDNLALTMIIVGGTNAAIATANPDNPPPPRHRFRRPPGTGPTRLACPGGDPQHPVCAGAAAPPTRIAPPAGVGRAASPARRLTRQGQPSPTVSSAPPDCRHPRPPPATPAPGQTRRHRRGRSCGSLNRPAETRW